ncbi:hypothetical protein D3C83_243320 [compost metagenome]
MLVPGKLALEFHHHQIVAIERADHARLPMALELRELVGEIDLFHGSQWSVVSR